MKWFKFYGQDYLSDPKMLSLSACERSCLITLLAYSSINDNGMITFLDEQQLMTQAGISFQDDTWEHTVGVLEKFKNLGIIDIDNGMITVKNWQKRQETNLTSYERVKRHRQKKHNDNAKITLEENRIDKKRKEDNKQNTNSETSSPEIPLLIKSFETLNPASKKFYGNKTQRGACKFLIENYGLERVVSVIEKTLPKTNGIQFFPTITTPLQLQDKWVALESAIRKYQSEKQNITSKNKVAF